MRYQGDDAHSGHVLMYTSHQFFYWSCTTSHTITLAVIYNEPCIYVLVYYCGSGGCRRLTCWSSYCRTDIEEKIKGKFLGIF